MSDRSRRDSSPPSQPKASNKPDTSANTETESQQSLSSHAGQGREAITRHTSTLHPHPTPSLQATDAEKESPDTNHPGPATPLIIVTCSPKSPATQGSSTAETTPRQGRALVSRRRVRNSSSQPPRRSTTPYARPRSRSQPYETAPASVSAMSSASSSPGSTTTSGPSAPYGGGSGSNPSYHLPYAPFPYPMPGNAGSRGGSGQGTQGGSGAGGK